MTVLQIMVIAFVGMASACTTKGRNGQPVVDSGSVDIPIRLQFQQGPIPSASVSVGIESKMNQNVGNGVYRQTQFNGGFELQGAAVPVLDADNNIQGVRADLDTHVSHDHKVVFLDHDPNIPTPKPNNNANGVAGAAQGGQQRQPSLQVQQEQYAAAQRPSAARAKPLRTSDMYDNDEKPTTQPSANIAGLKQEYFIAIMCVSCACFIALLMVLVIIAKKKQQVVEHITNIQRRATLRAPSTYSAPAYITPEISIDQKPPSQI